MRVGGGKGKDPGGGRGRGGREIKIVVLSKKYLLFTLSSLIKF